MADNVNITPTGSTAIATDDVGGVQYQRAKIALGLDGVNDQDLVFGAISTVNTSASTLTANSVFTGTSDDCKHYGSIAVNVFASHDSATGGLSIEFSSDGTNWDDKHAFDVKASVPFARVFPVTHRYCRVVYTNGGTNQTSFRLQTILRLVPVFMQPAMVGTVMTEAGDDRTIKTAKTRVAGSGANAFVTAVSGKKIRVIGYMIQAEGTVNVKFTDTAGSPADVSMLWNFQAREGVVAPAPPGGFWFETTAGLGVQINLSAGVATNVTLVYVEV